MFVLDVYSAKGDIHFHVQENMKDLKLKSNISGLKDIKCKLWTIKPKDCASFK